MKISSILTPIAAIVMLAFLSNISPPLHEMTAYLQKCAGVSEERAKIYYIKHTKAAINHKFNGSCPETEYQSSSFSITPMI